MCGESELAVCCRDLCMLSIGKARREANGEGRFLICYVLLWGCAGW